MKSVEKAQQSEGKTGPLLPGRRSSLLVIGGARSGKTRRALTHATAFRNKIYVATAEALDDEMSKRIDLHKAERANAWTTIEAPLELAAALQAVAPDGPPDACVVVVDCLTLWLTNVMMIGRDIEAETDRLISAIRECRANVVLVSNEVGLGIVPDNALARQFRDAQGRLNQRIAAAVDAVEFVAAGLALRMK